MKWQRGLFWTSMVSGAICLLLVAGYYGGRKMYASDEGVDRPGFEIWSKVYRRALFHSAINRKYYGYRYSDIGQIHEERFRYIVSDDLSELGSMETRCLRNERGWAFPGNFRWGDYDTMPELNSHYDIKFRLILDHSRIFDITTHDSSYEWLLRLETISVKGVSDE